MTKEIIIDGCNVAECEYLQEDYTRYDLCGNEHEEHNKCEIMTAYEDLINECQDNHNCYFKQLQRLKKELEIKEKQSEHFMIGSGEVLDKLKKENEELKKRCEELDKMTGIFSARLADKYKQALEEIKSLAELEVMFGENSKAFYPANIQRILDVINEVLNEQK